jgi:hypothetical protein
MLEVGPLQAESAYQPNTKLAGLYLRIIIEVGKPVNKVYPKEFKDIFYPITKFNIRLCPI